VVAMSPRARRTPARSSTASSVASPWRHSHPSSSAWRAVTSDGSPTTQAPAGLEPGVVGGTALEAQPPELFRVARRHLRRLHHQEGHVRLRQLPPRLSPHASETGQDDVLVKRLDSLVP